MAAEHLSQNQLVGYRAKTLSPDELLAVDRHLASCNACHERLRQLSPAERDSSYDLSSDEAFHLDYDHHLVPYVDCTADEIDREIIESHIALCSQCAEDIRDLQKFRQQPVPPLVTREIPRRTQPREGWRWPRVLTPQLTGAVAIALSLLGITAAVMMWRLNNPPQPDLVTAPAPSLQEKGYPGPWTDQTPKEPSPSPSRSTPLIALNDGGRQITIEKNGQSTGLESLSPDLRTAVEDVLAKRKFNKSPAVGNLSEADGRTRGGSEEQETIEQLSPAGVVIETDRPVFRWRALEGASDYVVTVHDSTFRAIESSGPTTATDWTVPKPLPRGVTYSWQIRTVINGKTVISPKPPAPEMRFKVLDQKAFAAIENARRAHGNSHLAMAVLYWKHGLLADAERELVALSHDNPDSTVATELLRSLRSLRRR
ncbi:MAG TPA: hypothetical protein VFS76_26010 [Pyrinomonadaceae bacterium]|nr:hypothetical protein [Pyrinomonadaceae bacterium]